LLRTGLLVEVATHLTLALTTAPWTAAAILTVFGIHTMVWGVVVATIRQQAVPDHLRGRVGSVYALLETGGAALGSLLGGLFAQALGITAPFWIAAAAMTAPAAFNQRRPEVETPSSGRARAEDGARRLARCRFVLRDERHM